ncbi:hypothetical protein A3H03_02610 [Candidatus Kuenenbacteria bacterium RIFCSPLOWO2_12_FULL_42_13]|uniref:Uncharacterized protein n=3 Tax=Candidatus Kueneniibacteriota TaxID=1752740 RepID=A0A1F6G266_9BACT|nr:MAG: hypothetical protein A3H03_02610 [Candidatus Kuenenbacteria bacterium RIFCSPLOWO2_12_FULL_42_13]OGG95682.1 MAG: hypothetical protein A2V95_02230 [Candidatus Kuenenbacteria bacterium RBG_16_41_7]OGG99514.1 MAG: hypothetical protein A3E04_02540 [Candidatus Kuenenbacteria bacterium RIFCSPHIGHO2_12_FULL_42_14]
MRHYLSQISKRQEGIALVLSVLVLSNLLMITFIVTDVILRIGKTSREIGESEAAYFAAETAIEQAVYKIEKERDGSEIGTAVPPDIGFLNDFKATWRRYLSPINTTPIICVDDNNVSYIYTTVADVSDPLKGGNKSCLYTATAGNITKGNPLKVKLRGTKSFEINFNVAVPASLNFYPPSIDIDWPNNTPGRIVILSATGQEVIDTMDSPSQKKIPSSGQFGNTPNYRIRVLNNGFSDVTYDIGPHNSSPGNIMPVGIEIVGKGYFNNQKERIIVVDKKSWKIY